METTHTGNDVNAFLFQEWGMEREFDSWCQNCLFMNKILKRNSKEFAGSVWDDCIPTMYTLRIVRNMNSSIYRPGNYRAQNLSSEMAEYQEHVIIIGWRSEFYM